MAEGDRKCYYPPLSTCGNGVLDDNEECELGGKYCDEYLPCFSFLLYGCRLVSSQYSLSSVRASASCFSSRPLPLARIASPLRLFSAVAMVGGIPMAQPSRSATVALVASTLASATRPADSPSSPTASTASSTSRRVIYTLRSYLLSSEGIGELTACRRRLR